MERSEGRVQDAVVPARVEGPAEEQVGAVVGDDQTVGLHRLDDSLDAEVGRGDADTGLQPQPSAHRKRIGRAGIRGGIAGEVGRRKHVVVRGPHGHADRVANRVGVEIGLVVSNQPRQDGEAGGVGGREALRPPIVGFHVEERARAGLPARAVVEDVVELVQELAGSVHDQQVPIGEGAAVDVPGVALLDPVRQGDGLVRDRIEGDADPVALAGVKEGHDLLRLRAAYVDIGEAVDVGASRGYLAAEVGARRLADTDEVDEVRRVGIHRRGADVQVPPVAGREQRQRAGQKTTLTGRPGGTGGRLGQGRRHPQDDDHREESEAATGPHLAHWKYPLTSIIMDGREW